MSQFAEIRDIQVLPSFMDDFNRVPKNIQPRIEKRINTMLDRILEHGGFLPSMHVREAFQDGYWMANVTQKRQAYRILFWIDGGVVVLERLLTHDERDEYLRV